MKKKIVILLSILLVVALLVPFIPTEHFKYLDGGTAVYRSVMCTYVLWNKMMLGTDEKTQFYRKLSIFWGKNKDKTIDELWQIEHPDSENE